MRNPKMWAVAALMLLSARPALAEIVVVVSAKSSVNALSKSQLSDLFLGKTSTLPDGSQAVPIDQSPGSPEREEFHAKVTGKSAAQLRSYWAKQVFSGKGTPPKEVAGDAEVKRLIANNPNTIGYIDKAAVDASLKVVGTP